MYIASRSISVLLLAVAGLLSSCVGQTALPESRFVEKAPDEPTTPLTEFITVAAVGDIMLGSPYPNDTRMPPNDGADLLKEFTPLISAADIAFGNLEGPMVDGGTSTKCRPPRPGQPIRCFAFRMPTRYGKYLKDAGFDVLSLANNHALDFGAAGSLSTRQTLDALGIKHAGSDKEKFSTVFIDVKGFRVAVVAFAHNAVVPNVNDLDAARMLVSRAARDSDIVIVSFHGGAEGTDHQNVPRATEIYAGERRGNLPLFSRTVIDAGADLVLGHGPHVLRGLELYKDRLIAYSLGNFATYGWFRLEAETALTMLLEVKLGADGRFIEGRINSGRQEGRGIPVLDPDGAALKKVKALSAADFPDTSPRFETDGRILPR